MRLLGLAADAPTALRDALRHRGWDAVRAEAAAAGLVPTALTADALDDHQVEGLSAAARRMGIDCLTGDDWALLVASRARLASLARAVGSDASLGPVTEAVARLTEGPDDEPPIWRVRGGALRLDRPVVMGVVNVTPDSFSDGGRFLDPHRALRQAERLLADGADVLDVGAESTRPGRSSPVSAADECGRLLPVIERVCRDFPEAIVSVDTVRSETAQRALEAGARIVNDVTALRHDPTLAARCAEAGAGLVLMHSRGGLLELADYEHARYGPDPAVEVALELRGAVARAEAAGVAREAIVVDPGFGFAKRPEHNWQILRRLETIASLGLPVLIGPSRKRFLGEATGRPVDERDVATAAACALGWVCGARAFRVHDVAHARDALAVARAFTDA